MTEKAGCSGDEMVEGMKGMRVKISARALFFLSGSVWRAERFGEHWAGQDRGPHESCYIFQSASPWPVRLIQRLALGSSSNKNQSVSQPAHRYHSSTTTTG